MMTLIRRELRGIRLLWVVLAIATVAAFFGARYLAAKSPNGLQRFGYPLFEAIWTLVAGALLSDRVIVREAAGGGRRMLAKWPVPMRWVFAAKLTAAVLAHLALLALAVGASVGADAFVKDDQRTMAGPIDLAAFAAMHVGVLGSVLLMGTLVPRAIGAFAGALVVGFGFFASSTAAFSLWLARLEVTLGDFRRILTQSGMITALALILAAGLAFTRGAVHRGTRLRTVVAAALGVAIVLLPSAAFGWARLQATLRMPEADEVTGVHVLFASETDDGHWIGMGVMKGRQVTPYYVVKRLEDGRTIELGRGRMPGRPDPQSLVLPIYDTVQSTEARRADSGLTVIGSLDLRSGRSLAVAPRVLMAAFWGAQDIDLRSGNLRGVLVGSSASVVLETRDDEGRVLGRRPVPGQRFGVWKTDLIAVRSTESGEVEAVVIDIATHEERLVALPGAVVRQGHSTFSVAVAASRFVRYLAAGGTVVAEVDLETGAYRALATIGAEAPATMIGVSAKGRWVVVNTGDRRRNSSGTLLIDSETGEIRTLPDDCSLAAFWAGDAISPREDAAVVLRRQRFDGQRLFLDLVDFTTTPMGEPDRSALYEEWIDGDHMIVHAGRRLVVRRARLGTEATFYP